MDRRYFLQLSASGMALALRPNLSSLYGEDLQSQGLSRGLVLCIDERLELEDISLARIREAVGISPLLRILSDGKSIQQLRLPLQGSEETSQLAFNHVLLIAKADHPLLLQAWQNEAIISRGSLYAFGFGEFTGSVGYIESDRNPFLHAMDIPKAPYECEFISITGTDDRAISRAVDAFLEKGLVNGLVAEDNAWKRSSGTLLDRDPLSSSFELPGMIPSTYDSLTRIACIQASEDEYRGVLADTGVEPLAIWRAKYYEAGQWDYAGEISAFHNYSIGLHRRAYGNTFWAASFDTSEAALDAAPKIAKSMKISSRGTRWYGSLTPYAWGRPNDGDTPRPGTVELWVDGPSVLIFTRTSNI